MKQILRKLSLVALMSVCTFVGVTSARVVQRSQTVDAARNLAGWTNHINLFDMGGFYGSFAITPEYTRSFNGDRIAESVFPTNGALGFCGLTCPATCPTVCNTGCDTSCDDNSCGSFLVQGRNVASRAANSILADYAGLPSDYSSTVEVCPRIQNFLVDFNLFLGLDEWLCGMWFRIHAPVVYAKWNLNYSETIAATSGSTAYPAGYFASAAVPAAQLNKTFGEYLAGNAPDLGNTGAQFLPLTNSKLCGFNSAAMSSCKSDCSSRSRHTTKLSDIEFALGWNFWQDEDYHLGLGLVVRAPTGNRINDTFLFEPMVGNGHHWELGGLLTSHYTFWRSCDYDQSLGFYLDAWITHMFQTKQWRSFDLCCSRGLNSRYMLAEQFTTANVTVGADAGAGAVYASAQFNGTYAPVANLTFQQVNVSIPVQADVVAMFNYTNCGYSWDLGYNFWGTSCEKIETCRNNVLTGQNWGLKGDASTYGFTAGGVAVALSATETGTCAAPEATICSGTNGALLTNANVENAFPALTGTPPAAPATPLLVAVGGAAINTSLDPVFLTDADIDYCGARSKGLTHKIFTHFAYTWEECDCYIPYLGLGVFVEFAQKHKRCDNDNNNCATASCNTGSCGVSTSSTNNSCHNGAFSQWGLWLKGGVSFN